MWQAVPAIGREPLDVALIWTSEIAHAATRRANSSALHRCRRLESYERISADTKQIAMV
jgi:hypothetical protein